MPDWHGNISDPSSSGIGSSSGPTSSGIINSSDHTPTETSDFDADLNLSEGKFFFPWFYLLLVTCMIVRYKDVTIVWCSVFFCMALFYQAFMAW